MLRLGPPRAVLQSAISCGYSMSIPAQLCENICSLTNYTSSWETNWNKKPTERNSMDWNTLNNFADFSGPVCLLVTFYITSLSILPCDFDPVHLYPHFRLCAFFQDLRVSHWLFQPRDQDLGGERVSACIDPCVELPYVLFYVHLVKKITPLLPIKQPLYGT